MVATVVASTTVAVAAASLGDFAVAAAAVKLEDVAGSRRRAVVARGVGGGAVGACGGVLAGWRWGQLGRRKAVVAPMNSAGVGRNHGNIPNKKPQETAIWAPSGLNHRGMGKKRRVGTGCEAGVSEPLW